MNEQRFETQWSLAEAEGYASRLASEYPSWLARTRRTTGVVMGLALAVALAVPLLLPLTAADNAFYTNVYCNRTGTADSHWVDLADELLLV